MRIASSRVVTYIQWRVLCFSLFSIKMVQNCAASGSVQSRLALLPVLLLTNVLWGETFYEPLSQPIYLVSVPSPLFPHVSNLLGIRPDFFLKARRRKSPGSSASFESSSYARLEQSSGESVNHCWLRTLPEASMRKICPISIHLTSRYSQKSTNLCWDAKCR